MAGDFGAVRARNLREMVSRLRWRHGGRRPQGLAYVYAPPERHIIANGFRFGRRIRIGPGGVGVEAAVYGNGEVMRGPLPGADGGLGRRFKKIVVDRSWRKIVVAFHYDGRVTV